MSIEEIIKRLAEIGADYAFRVALKGNPSDADMAQVEYDKQIVLKAIALLKTHPEAQPNEPLTEEELREMDGSPAYLSFGEGVPGEWVLIIWDDRRPMVRHKNGSPGDMHLALSLGAKLYRRPPKEES